MRLIFAVCGSLVAAVGLAACGSSGGYGDSSGSPTAPGGPITNTIAIVANDQSRSFMPNPAPVGGESAVWRNNDNQTHRIVANNGSFDTGNLAPGATSPMIPLPASGTNYHCVLHPTMIGAIGAAGGQPPPPCTDELYC